MRPAFRKSPEDGITSSACFIAVSSLARDVSFRLLLGYLPDQVLVGAFLVEVLPGLCLRVKLREDFTIVDVRAGGTSLVTIMEPSWAPSSLGARTTKE